MEAGDTNFAEYSNIMAAVDKAIQESYYRMCSEKMISKVKLNENTASRDQPAQNNIKCHTPGAPKKSKKHATFPSTDDEHNKLDESEHIPGNTNDASSVDNINTVTTATEDIIDKNVFDQNTMHTSKNVEKCLENIDIVKGNHNNCQDNPTFKNIEDESKEDKELDSQISVFDNDDSAEKNKTKFGSENIGVCENQTGPFCIIKRENNTTENEPLINSEHDIGVDRGNEKGMNCRDCGNKFPNAYQLSQHKRTVPECGSSNIVRSYRCQLCERLFSSSSRLRKHLRTHLGTKPYKCNICQKQFTQSHNLKRHILIHTGNLMIIKR